MFDAAGLRRSLNAWYREHGRHELPWRLTRDPYAILVSEVMLQQTQVERVLPYWRRWMQRWPAFPSLAAASPAEVIREWRGLGYNRRVLALQQAAVVIVEQHGGELRTGVRMRELPGVGPYTESAIRCFAWGEQVPVADTNIARVVARTVLSVTSQREAPARSQWSLPRPPSPARAARPSWRRPEAWAT